ncbi:hypothetical protein F383_23050 [Gossypium arboreum]|uniref:Uncharacterized protein n=1 Tax=Gossypium arboreum TaxID=29729 RepID=A0A0B0P1F5_GOSAR|nr:hypothetical protein F383_23050 [Gossypium arboreum]
MKSKSLEKKQQGGIIHQVVGASRNHAFWLIPSSGQGRENIKRCRCPRIGSFHGAGGRLFGDSFILDLIRSLNTMKMNTRKVKNNGSN